MGQNYLQQFHLLGNKAKIKWHRCINSACKSKLMILYKTKFYWYYCKAAGSDKICLERKLKLFFWYIWYISFRNRDINPNASNLDTLPNFFSKNNGIIIIIIIIIIRVLRNYAELCLYTKFSHQEIRWN